MGRRHYKRQPLVVQVTVTGVDENGNPFSQTAATVDVSARGLRLQGLACLRGHRGESVLVRHKRHAAKYRVIWVAELGIVGLEALEDPLPLFREYLSANIDRAHVDPDPFVLPTQQSSDRPALAIEPETSSANVREERRRHPRYSCSGTVRLRESHHEVWVDARVNEISMGGCYVETMSPFRLGTFLELELDVGGQNILLQGIVRNAQPTVGMGIEFTRIQPREAEKLYRVVAQISGPGPEKATFPSPKPDLIALADDVSFERAITTWFGLHDVLTRQDFLKLREEVQRRLNEAQLLEKSPPDRSEKPGRQANPEFI